MGSLLGRSPSASVSPSSWTELHEPWKLLPSIRAIRQSHATNKTLVCGLRPGHWTHHSRCVVVGMENQVIQTGIHFVFNVELMSIFPDSVSSFPRFWKIGRIFIFEYVDIRDLIGDLIRDLVIFPILSDLDRN